MPTRRPWPSTIARPEHGQAKTDGNPATEGLERRDSAASEAERQAQRAGRWQHQPGRQRRLVAGAAELRDEAVGEERQRRERRRDPHGARAQQRA